MHPPSQSIEPSARPESSWVLPESSGTDESGPPLEAPPPEELPLEEPLLEEPPLEEPLLEEPLLEEPPLEEPLPPEVASGAAPSFDSAGLEAPGELEEHAGTRGAVTSAKPKMRRDRAVMFRGKAIPMPCSGKLEIPDDRRVRLRGAARYVASPAPYSATRAAQSAATVASTSGVLIGRRSRG
jgi:hypothetical protein